MTQEELNAAIELHHEWLRTEEASGERLNLESQDLAGLVFDGASLIRSRMVLCDCTGASFVGTNLAQAELKACKFDASTWLGANAFEADFTSCTTSLWTAPAIGGPAT